MARASFKRCTLLRARTPPGYLYQISTNSLVKRIHLTSSIESIDYNK